MSKYGKRTLSKISGRRVNEHVKTWEEYYEIEVPFDEYGNRCFIHHIDGNTLNNNIENLRCMTKAEHTKLHSPSKKEEIKEKMSLALLGHFHSEEAKKKMSKSRKGIKKSEEHRKKIGLSNIGKHNIKCSEETKIKISKKTKGKLKRKIICPYCGKIGGNGPMQRWHFQNCKNKKGD